MSVLVSYHLGGFQSAAPAQNRAELLDGAAATYTRWDAAGAQVEQRPLTAPEVSFLAAQDATQVVETARQARLVEIRAVQATLATLRGQATTLAGKVGTAWTQAEIRALGNGLVQLIDTLTAVGKEALKED